MRTFDIFGIIKGGVPGLPGTPPQAAALPVRTFAAMGHPAASVPGPLRAPGIPFRPSRLLAASGQAPLFGVRESPYGPDGPSGPAGLGKTALG